MEGYINKVSAGISNKIKKELKSHHKHPESSRTYMQEQWMQAFLMIPKDTEKELEDGDMLIDEMILFLD